MLGAAVGLGSACGRVEPRLRLAAGSLIESRYAASIDPDVVANPPLQRPAGLGTLWRMDFTRDRRLSTLETPTLVIWGRDDKVNKPSSATMLAQRMPNADVLITANTGHWVQWERADFFNAVTTAFLTP